jgi:hypothetical protein
VLLTNPQACYESTHHHVDPGRHCSNLDDIADNEDGYAKSQAASSSPPIGSIGTTESTDEGANRHQRDQKGLRHGFEGFVSWWTLPKSTDEVLKEEHTRNLTLGTSVLARVLTDTRLVGVWCTVSYPVNGQALVSACTIR